MAVIINAKLKLNKLNKDKIFKGKVHNFYDITIKLKDETKFGKNVDIETLRSKEERDAGVPIEYIGEGEVVWLNEKGATKVQKEEVEPQAESQSADEFPF